MGTKAGGYGLSGIALFDVDGVLVKGFTMLSFGRFLHQLGLVPRRRWLRLYADYEAYKNGTVPYAQFASASVVDFALALAGLNQVQMLQEAERLCRKRSAFYWYASSLVGLFKQRGILTVAISGAPEECVQPLQTELGLDEFYGTVFELDDKRTYSGRVSTNMALHSSKEAVTSALRRRVDFSNSFAFGDTAQDLPILEKVAHPVAMNPKGELLNIAADRGWMAITYRHDVLKHVRKLLG